ncbi:MAG: YfhO family protein, partial [Chloroflexi bacterium]|nr:YfhO family protein [Chloroflexota bacterium]
ARYVPGFAHFRVPARWLALYALGMAALAGWGTDVLWRYRRGVGWRAILMFAVALVALAGWAVMGLRIGEGGRVGWPTVAGWAVGIILALGLLLATKRAPRLAAVGLLMLLLVELFAASSTLPHSRATAPQAFTSLRPSIAHLLVADLPLPLAAEGRGEGVPARFISMSDITFDPGDLPEIEIIYGPQLSADALYDYVIAAKHKEVLSPNLPLAFGVSAVDGYDGGVLPLARYVTLQRLFLPDDEVSIDGRLRENLTTIPEGRWLNLFNVRHVVTDKLHDAWLDGVFCDLQFGAQLSSGQAAAVAHVPHFEATALGLVSYLRGGAALPDGTPVGVVEVGFGDGITRGLTRTFELRAGEHTAEGLYGPDVAHAQATVGGHFWPGVPEGNDYVTRLRWKEPNAPSVIVVRATLPEGELVVRGVSVVDERTEGFQALVLSDRGRFRLAHSGDVKIYENLDVLERAFVVHQAVVADDDEAALALMRSESFDPAAQVVLAGRGNQMGLPTGRGDPVWSSTARVTHYAPERVEIEVVAETSGYLVLADAWYPGWQAMVDGEPVPVRRVDLFFRAVAVDAGQHRVVFTFRPASLRVGAGVSLVGLVGLLGVSVLALSKAGRGDIMDATTREGSKEDKR